MTSLAPNSFNILFQFRNEHTCFFETNRLDIPETHPPSERFQWFHYQQTPTDHLEALHFEGMGQSEGQQWRQFKEGRLVFNGESAMFTPKDSPGTQVQLTASTEPMPETVWQKVIQFFR